MGQAAPHRFCSLACLGPPLSLKSATVGGTAFSFLQEHVRQWFDGAHPALLHWAHRPGIPVSRSPCRQHIPSEARLQVALLHAAAWHTARAVCGPHVALFVCNASWGEPRTLHLTPRKLNCTHAAGRVYVTVLLLCVLLWGICTLHRVLAQNKLNGSIPALVGHLDKLRQL